MEIFIIISYFLYNMKFSFDIIVMKQKAEPSKFNI